MAKFLITAGLGLTLLGALLYQFPGLFQSFGNSGGNSSAELVDTHRWSSLELVWSSWMELVDTRHS